MNLDFTDDQRALHDTLRDFFEKESPPAVSPSAFPPTLQPSRLASTLPPRATNRLP